LTTPLMRLADKVPKDASPSFTRSQTNGMASKSNQIDDEENIFYICKIIFEI